MMHARLILAVLLLGSASQAESRSSAATADTSVNVIRTQEYRAIAAQQLKRLSAEPINGALSVGRPTSARGRRSRTQSLRVRKTDQAARPLGMAANGREWPRRHILRRA